MVVLERGVVSLLERPLRPPEVETCVAEARLLTNWCFALDLVSSGRLARDIGRGFSTPNLTNRDAATLSARIDDLRRDLDLAADDWWAAGSSTAHVHVVSPVDARIDAVMWHLKRQGVLVTHSPTYMSAPENADAIAVYSPTNIRDSRALLVGIGRRSASIRRIAIHDLVGDVTELTSISSHCDLIVSLTAHPKELAEEITATAQPDPGWLKRAVLLGADHAYAHLLPFKFVGHVAASLPEALDHLGGSSNVFVVGAGVSDPAAVVSLVRATPAIRSCIVATIDVDAATALRCRQAGADLVVETGGNSDSWGLHLRGLAQRRTRVLDQDEVTARPIPTWSRASVQLDRVLGGLSRSRGLASLAIISIPSQMKPESLEELHAAISTEFRRDDLLGQLDDRRIVVLLKGAVREAAVKRMELAIENLGLPPTPGRAGVAEFPVDGLGLDGLLESAADAKVRSIESLGPAVTGSDWFGDRDDVPDVMLVESDRTLATVLEQLLGQLSLSCTHVATGSEALRHFADGPTRPIPPLLILELDAMGADGLMILRSLARSGVLDRTKVVVTCSRIRDGELKEAFELGAVDVIRKPFSAVVLSNRIQRILAA